MGREGRDGGRERGREGGRKKEGKGGGQGNLELACACHNKHSDTVRIHV